MTEALVREETVEDRQLAEYALRQQLGFKLSRTSRLMQQRLEAVLAPQGLTRLTWCVLSSIGLEGISTPSGIADNLGVTRPMLSRLIKAMSRDGLIEITLDPDDGRNRQLRLTAAGRSKLMACKPLVQDNNTHFSRKLTAAQMQALHELVDLLIDGETPYLDSL
ncbi:MarR family winged helix-turn-helix transcriptional regulator [Marinovum algicola]|jgi:MarR family transcriptional regulator for hemolysin|uniref:MarR family winged helix-turn-helix transcriptional regulator n=1 Tax=Marinovum algicola TaxID=42444 RepID=UPI0024B9C933|nr:MarR family winged helix-turn-helix transcriptional regulator [Marinovum algicola]